MEEVPNITVSKGGFPTARNSLPGISTQRETMAMSGMFRSKNSSFLDQRNLSIGESTVRGAKNNRAFGFHNHSFALGSTVRHFQTISDFPSLPSKLDRVQNRAEIEKMK